MPLAPRLASGSSTPGGATTSASRGETGNLGNQAVDFLWEHLHVGPAPLPGLDDDIGDEGVEDDADSEEAGTPRVGTVGIPGIQVDEYRRGMAAETVHDFRDRYTGPRTSGLVHGSAANAGGGGSHGGYPRCGSATVAGTAPEGTTPNWLSAGPGPPSALDLEQVLQALLLHQGLLEDHEVAAHGEFGDTWGGGTRPGTGGPGATTPSWRTLREMRRHGPLGELNEDAQTTLLGGTLYAYGGQELGSESAGTSSSSVVIRGTPAMSMRSQRRNGQLMAASESHETSYDSGSLEASSHATQQHGFWGQLDESTIEDSGELISQAGAGPAFTHMLQLSLDRILQQSHREPLPASARGALQTQAQQSLSTPSAQSSAGFRFGGISSGAAMDRSVLNTARSIRTVSSSVIGPQSPGAGSGASVTEDILDASFASRVEGDSREMSENELRMRELQAAILDPSDHHGLGLSAQAGRHGGQGEEDEGIVSVVGFDSPRSLDTPSAAVVRRPQLPPSQPHSPSGDRDLMEETGSVWGLGDTVNSSTSTVRSDSAQHSARTEAGLEGVTGMFARLASENLVLDESVTRSVRRVLQLGAVLTGQRLSEDEVHALPQVRFDGPEQQNCAICLEAYRQGEFLTSLRCGHFFHVECLGRWFQRSTQCPLCRSECLA